MNFNQRQKLISLCESKLNEFLESRGLKLWDYRLIDNPVPDSLRYKVLKKSKHRCELCGATKYDRPLDVDHIIPRSKGGKSDESNLRNGPSKNYPIKLTYKVKNLPLVLYCGVNPRTLLRVLYQLS